MAKNVAEKIKLTINEWLENLPSKEKTLKTLELKTKCNVALSTVYNWKNGKRPRKEHRKKIQEIAGKDITINFN